MSTLSSECSTLSFEEQFKPHCYIVTSKEDLINYCPFCPVTKLPITAMYNHSTKNFVIVNNHFNNSNCIICMNSLLKCFSTIKPRGRYAFASYFKTPNDSLHLNLCTDIFSPHAISTVQLTLNFLSEKENSHVYFCSDCISQYASRCKLLSTGQQFIFKTSNLQY